MSFIGMSFPCGFCALIPSAFYRVLCSICPKEKDWKRNGKSIEQKLFLPNMTFSTTRATPCTLTKLSFQNLWYQGSYSIRVLNNYSYLENNKTEKSSKSFSVVDPSLNTNFLINGHNYLFSHPELHKYTWKGHSYLTGGYSLTVFLLISKNKGV